MICANYKDLIIPKNLMSPNWEKALAWLKADSWKDMPQGKTEIDGTNVFATRSSYTSKLRSECRYESHRRYADIQMIIKGSEIQLACLSDGLNITDPYSEEKDIEFFGGEPKTYNSIILNFPMVAVYFPWDLHMPNIALDDKPSEMERVIFKVAL